MKELVLRHETKHDITYSEFVAVKSRLLAIAKRDPNVGESGLYQIRSLYFDNYNDKALREKLDGVNIRDKFRIRYYNNDPSIIKLEKKSKINGLCNKQSASITKEQVESIIAGDYEFLKDSKNALMVELYAKMSCQLLRPRVIVDYTREPFVYEPGNVRITFDTNIRSGLYSKNFFDPDVPEIRATTLEGVLMEVKYDEFLPEVISMCIQVNERPGQAFSKYAACRRFG